MSQLKGSEYKQIVKQVFTEVKSDGSEIKTKFVNEVDPIVQSSAKFQNKKPEMSKTTKEYYAYAYPKDERLHRKVDYQKTNIFFENQTEDTRPRPKKKMINNEDCKQSLIEKRSGIKMISNPTTITSNNPIAHTTNQPLPIQRLAKNHNKKPSDTNGLLQSPHDTEGTQAQTQTHSQKHSNPSFNSNQIFREGSQYKSTPNADNTQNPYPYDKYSSFKTDHVVGIFNSKINEKVKEQPITQKPNADSYSTFVNEAREICYDRYQDYY